jgi:hypothetical protein
MMTMVALMVVRGYNESDRGADKRTAPFVWVRHMLTHGKRTCATAESGKRVARGWRARELRLMYARQTHLLED